MAERPRSTTRRAANLTRRAFITGAGATALSVTILKPELAGAEPANSKISWGLVGCGGRGGWIANLFQKHGGYHLVAVADYFPDRTDAVGDKFQIPASARFSGLSGYKRLLEQKLDAVVIESPPYFHPEQAAAAVDAGKHVFLAKPIAVDVPGCISVLESSDKANEGGLCFLVDFQTRAHPIYQEAVQRVRDGEIGPIVSVETNYQTSTMFANLDAKLRADPKNAELRLRAWALDSKLSGDVITEQNIHALDVATWFLDADPISAYGSGGRARPFCGDCWDHFAVLFHFPKGITANFSSKQVGQGYDDIMCRVYGMKGTADTHYFGDVSVRSDKTLFAGKMENLYADGAVRNIATFYDNITKVDFSNLTTGPSVRSNLTTILGRTAAYRKREVTWTEMMHANEKLEFDLRGLKA